jgi:ParB family transcriptional regulator, chromosome partitioning protein
MSKAEELRRANSEALRETASHRPPPAAMPNLSIGTAVAGERMRDVLRSKTSLEIPVEKIERDPSQPREIFDEDEHVRLTESIRRRGVRMRISVRWSEESGRYLVVAGERRLRAAKAAGLATIPCDVVEANLTPEDILVIQGIENLIRDDLKPIEQAKLFRTLLAANNWTQAELSSEFGISQPTISQTLSLLELAPEVQARVEVGELAATVAAEIASKLDDHDDQRRVAEQIVTEKLTRPEAVKSVREVAAQGPKTNTDKGRGGKAKAKIKLVTSRVFRHSSGIRLTAERGKGIELLALVETLRAALEQAEGELPGHQG